MKAQDLRLIAMQAVIDVANDPEAPAAARGAAARTILEVIGDIGRGAVPLSQRELKDLTELSPEELAQEISKTLD